MAAISLPMDVLLRSIASSTTKLATSVEANVFIPDFDRVTIEIAIQAEGLETELAFTPNWKAAA